MNIDLRSDTVTQPSAAMKEAMMNAPLGDDVFAEDPSVNALQEYAAEMFGMEAALYCPSGTMTNQIAVKVHTQPLDEVILHKLAHIYYYEVGGFSFNSGVSVKLCDGPNGKVTPADVKANTMPDYDWFPNTSLVCLENTVNKGGGCCYELSEMQAVKNTCDELGLKLHLDGARLFNAMVYKGYSAKELGGLFDSISICLSKGLGAPIGSLLLGTKDAMKKARKIRKVLGGGMRQGGVIAAAGLYALQNNIDRLAEDHQRAKALEETLSKAYYVKEVLPVETNIVIFHLDENIMSAPKFCEFLAKCNIKAVPVSTQGIRLVTHLDYDDEMLQRTIDIIRNYR